MASISTDAKGNRKIQFTHLRKRRTVYVGDMTVKATKHVKDNIEALVTATLSRTSPDPKVAEWVGTIPDWLAEKLAKVELIAPRESQADKTKLLGSFLTDYLATRSDVKPNTQLKYESTRRCLVEFFGGDRSLRTITPGCADEFRLMLVARKVGDKPLSENTIRKHIAVAKVFFKAAVRKNLIPSNPFDGHKATIQENPDRFYFVKREEIEQVIDACPDAQWRLIVALSRFGGLRCPSEHLALTWDHVDWERNRITVISPKTAHHFGKGSRVIPLFPELRQPLTQVFDQAEPGTQYVITRYRGNNQNLRTQFERIIRKAGLIPWLKPFQNMRSTRETELAEIFPLHVVVTWLGNSEPVARKHYLQTTDDHFARALKPATQNPTQKGTEIERNHIKRPLRPSEFLADSLQFSSVNTKTVAEAGIEPARPFRNPGF